MTIFRFSTKRSLAVLIFLSLACDPRDCVVEDEAAALADYWGLTEDQVFRAFYRHLIPGLRRTYIKLPTTIDLRSILEARNQPGWYEYVHRSGQAARRGHAR